MVTDLLEATKRFLEKLEETQAELESLLAKKRIALTEINSDDLVQLADLEGGLAVRLQALLAERRRLLSRAKQRQLPHESILKLVGAIGGAERETLETRIHQSQEMTVRLRHESWIHWIIAHRSHNHYTELLELIANCGEEVPTYHDGPNQTTAGGAVLDASI